MNLVAEANFFKDKQRSDGYYSYCKECQKSDRQKHLAKYKERNEAITEKQCSCCKEVKSRSEFYRNRSCSTGLKPNCKQCEKKMAEPHKAKMLAKLKQWAIENPELDKKNRRERYFKSTHGITMAERSAMIEKQNGQCAICGKVPVLSPKPQNGREEALCIDHCHRTGKVRGMLCDRCNTALGIFQDSETILQAAINYLREHET